ncbi:SRPBCC family protein [Phenylobacterium sp.]|uniref:SRPBCC family protein n=1 Tax=Phenylobacterium sp. TaxID=1871053 RepID=UPI00374D8465
MSQTIAPAAIRKSFTVRATPERAFEVFTAGLHRWWPKSHSIGDAPLKMATIEPRVGGRWYSLTEDGVEHEWGDVLAWEPPARLILAWRLNGAFTYDPDLLTEVEVCFAATGEGETRVDFEHRGLERFGAGEAVQAIRGGMDQGWGLILDAFQTVADA